ncbi:hypothetical protein FBEOM_9342 [Fusarium beomiforme]|uniref:Uncharacterized protein n=1 Tax=Fusarium beomiforme TaxID=44412 RepID=A0A9P5ADK1_9HYPO|nr:hypothetical protein FBEOM_9342 [Fusarium beomiforme]
MRAQASSWLLLLGAQLVIVVSSLAQSPCTKGSCMCTGSCRTLKQGESCCPPGGGWLEHICGPNKACCRSGCCPEGWKCGDNGMCGPPVATISNPTTIITLRKPELSSPTMDQNISSDLPEASLPLSVTTTHGEQASRDTRLSSVSSRVFVTAGPPPVLTLPSEPGPTVSIPDQTRTDTNDMTSGPNSQATTDSPREPSTHIPNGDNTTPGTQIVPVPSSELGSVITMPGGEVTTIYSTYSAGPGTDISETGTQASTELLGGGGEASTPTAVTSTNGNIPKSPTSGATLPMTKTTGTVVVSSEKASNTTPSGHTATDGTAATTLPSNTKDTLPPSQGTTGPTKDRDEPSSVPSDASTGASSVSNTEQTSNGEHQATRPVDTLITTPATKERATTAPGDLITTLPDGKVTTLPKESNSHVTQAPKSTETDGVVPVIIPITTPVPDPERSDGGIKIPCDMWFFDLCIAPIGGWSFVLPPGTHPPGPPPIIKIDPTAPIKVDITGSIPWPGFTIDPAGNPTFSSKPDDCKTQTAEMCVTTTSYGVSVDGTITSTTAESTVSKCGTIYGCDIEDEDTSKTISRTTTASTQTPTITAVKMHWETWHVVDYTEAELDDIADAAQARLDKEFGRSASTTPETTTEAFPTLTNAPSGVPTSSGFSCISTVTNTQCGGSGGREACVEKPSCASWVNTAAVTMTMPEITPYCSQGWQTYTATAHAAIPTQGGTLKFFIPTADDKGSDWDFIIDNDDVKEAVKSWKVGNDDDNIESGKGGKGLEIKWKVPDESNGTYVELELKASEINEKRMAFTAKGGVAACMTNCKNDATTTTDIDGMVCTRYPCNSPTCNQGPAPKPQAACELVEDGLGIPLFYTVTIVANGYSWIDDDGKKLKKQEGGCGAITDWHSTEIEVKTGDGWTARHMFTFTLPITIKAGCVERAIASAGGPSGIQCDNKEGDLWL